MTYRAGRHGYAICLLLLQRIEDDLLVEVVEVVLPGGLHQHHHAVSRSMLGLVEAVSPGYSLAVAPDNVHLPSSQLLVARDWEVTFEKELSYNYSYFQMRNLGTSVTSVTFSTTIETAYKVTGYKVKSLIKYIN